MTHLQNNHDYSFAQIYLQTCREVQFLANTNTIYNETAVPSVVLPKEEPPIIVLDDDDTWNPPLVPEPNDLQVTGVGVLKEWIDFSELSVNPQTAVARKQQVNQPQKHHETAVARQQHVNHMNQESEHFKLNKNKVGVAIAANHEGETNPKNGEIAVNPHETANVESQEDEMGENWADVDVEEAPESPAPQTSKFACSQCSYQTDWKSNLNKHVISRHQSEDEIKWHKCAHCPYKGKTSEYLKIHLRQLHEPFVQWFYCSKCPLKFKLNNTLKAHILATHTAPEDIKWFQCDKCDFKFKFKNQLVKHETNKHLTAGEINWFKCNNCDYKSKWKKVLKMHIMSKHTGYEESEETKWHVCNKCGRLLKGKQALNTHLSSYHCETKRKKSTNEENDREWKCDTCGFKTFSRKAFEEHFKTDGRSYFCA
ncbi:zinc finger protein ZFAT-like [Tribolium madens]|uniref:zinc finger protein ZFAT-like n=1 Tax=Tribolium madens TaxID=41895 RepID=UPI001CF7479B|nr:zinc finger protein ZFAT-like [Tribolium madens]XP_044272318.1 zinc finger protein ZFAT-like [Tribolium madens]